MMLVEHNKRDRERATQFAHMNVFRLQHPTIVLSLVYTGYYYLDSSGENETKKDWIGTTDELMILFVPEDEWPSFRSSLLLPF